MIDRKVFNDALMAYKENFNNKWWNDEAYKWKAIKCFQDNWNIDAENFPKMLEKSLDKTENLLVSRNYLPKRVILAYAESNTEEVRDMFKDLFDEDKDLYKRIKSFKDKSQEILENNYEDNNHYQNENTISTYLWLRYPDRYYIYKFSEAKATAEKLNSSFKFIAGRQEENLRNFQNLYDQINSYLKEDDEIKDILDSYLDEDSYSDPELKTLTKDFTHFVNRLYLKGENNNDLSTDDWLDLLNDKNIFTKESLEVMRRLKHMDSEEASCTELSEKYGESIEFYKNTSTGLAKRIAKEKSIDPELDENGQKKYWPILYTGRQADPYESGSFIWKLKDNLSEALDQVDLRSVNLYSISDNDPGYWFLLASPKQWSYNKIAVGDSIAFTLYNDKGNKRNIFKNFIDAKKDDLVIGYEATPRLEVNTLLKVKKEQDGEKIYFEKTENLANPLSLATIKSNLDLENMEFLRQSNGTFFKLSKDEYKIIEELIRENNVKPEKEKNPDYKKKEFLDEVYMAENSYDKLVAVLKNKKNIILQGPPGVGKTFAARRLAWSIMGEEDNSRIKFIQFHQNYSYEDFIMGYKPTENGFELKKGVFYEFCKTAENDPGRDYFLIIDEINRGNMSKIFGELLMLIENDYRGKSISLAYDDREFLVPKNLYIIGMMNTADRSLAMIDYALRRRFSFFSMEPGFKSEGFKKYQENLANEKFTQVIEKIGKLNEEIIKDESLGRGFVIGHSYFCGKEVCEQDWLESVIEFEILPMLREYWFDDETKANEWEVKLKDVFKWKQIKA